MAYPKWELGSNLLPTDEYPAMEPEWTLDDYARALRALKGCGGRWVAHGARDLPPERAEKVAQLQEDLGLRTHWVHARYATALNPDNHSVEEIRAILAEDVQICRLLGAPVLVLHPPALCISQAEVRTRVQTDTEIVRWLCDQAGSQGVSIALENMVGGVGNLNQGQYLRAVFAVAARVDAANLGFCIDTGHANVAWGLNYPVPTSNGQLFIPPETLGAPAIIRLMGDRILATHLQDNFGKFDEHLPPGIGTVDWQATLDALQEVGYQGPLTMELQGGKARGRTQSFDREFRQGFLNLQTFLSRDFPSVKF